MKSAMISIVGNSQNYKECEVFYIENNKEKSLNIKTKFSADAILHYLKKVENKKIDVLYIIRESSPESKKGLDELKELIKKNHPTIEIRDFPIEKIEENIISQTMANILIKMEKNNEKLEVLDITHGRRTIPIQLTIYVIAYPSDDIKLLYTDAIINSNRECEKQYVRDFSSILNTAKTIMAIKPAIELLNGKMLNDIYAKAKKRAKYLKNPQEFGREYSEKIGKIKTLLGLIGIGVLFGEKNVPLNPAEINPEDNLITQSLSEISSTDIEKIRDALAYLLYLNIKENLNELNEKVVKKNENANALTMLENLAEYAKEKSLIHLYYILKVETEKEKHKDAKEIAYHNTRNALMHAFFHNKEAEKDKENKINALNEIKSLWSQ